MKWRKKFMSIFLRVLISLGSQNVVVLPPGCGEVGGGGVAGVLPKAKMCIRL